MKRTCKLSLSFLCFLICFLLSMSGIRARDEALAADIAPKILRFHVLANSDSAKDQALKLREGSSSGKDPGRGRRGSDRRKRGAESIYPV